MTDKQKDLVNDILSRIWQIKRPLVELTDDQLLDLLNKARSLKNIHRKGKNDDSNNDTDLDDNRTTEA